MHESLYGQNIKSAPKSHLFLNKLKRISSIDREIRKKWSKLQQQKMQKEQQKFRQIIQIQKTKNLKNIQTKFQYTQPPELIGNRINKIRSQIIREEVHLRKKHYDDIFYKKREKKYKLKLNSSPQPIKSSQHLEQLTPTRRMKTQNLSESPLPLQKRDRKKQRQLNIIENNYREDLKKINKKSKMECFRIYSEQKDWLNKYKGNKVYYRIVSAWQPPLQ